MRGINGGRRVPSISLLAISASVSDLLCSTSTDCGAAFRASIEDGKQLPVSVAMSL